MPPSRWGDASPPADRQSSVVEYQVEGNPPSLKSYNSLGS
jgi:hypothetical protein